MAIPPGHSGNVHISAYTMANESSNTVYPQVAGSYVSKSLESNSCCYTMKYLEVVVDLPKIRSNININTQLYIRTFIKNDDPVHQIFVDDVRFRPYNSQMRTHTFNPQVGITSTTGTNNTITRYEYDEFNRPVIVKDKGGNILNRTTYSINE